jgi:hypothetical protein
MQSVRPCSGSAFALTPPLFRSPPLPPPPNRSVTFSSETATASGWGLLPLTAPGSPCSATPVQGAASGTRGPPALRP